MISIITIILLTSLATRGSCRIHKLLVTDDSRSFIQLTTFGFLKGGLLDVKMTNFKVPPGKTMGTYGFTLDKTINDATNPYLEAATDTCFLEKNQEASTTFHKHQGIIFLKMNFEDMKLDVACKGDIDKIHLAPNRSFIADTDQLFISRAEFAGPQKFDDPYLPITKLTRDGVDFYSTGFAMKVVTEDEEGLYNLYFHNCPSASSPMRVNFLVDLFEINAGNNYLSAGEIPLPQLYKIMSIVFFLSAGLWTYILKTSKHPVFRIHILMCILVYLKALSLAFHGINYYFIEKKGEHVTAWAILYYITHLLKGAVLFVTIALVGTGWNFIKDILADRDKKLFMVVIPLQVVANVAEIIIEESEEGAIEHNVMRDIFTLVDLICCGAIMFPVVWSIRHLQDASSTDGKAAINLRKLKLFRHFYLMILCYIYFTRMIVYLLQMLVRFEYSWIDELFRQLATFSFFVLTGYKFRPAAANPYFTPTQVDDEDSHVLSDIGILDGAYKVTNRHERKREDMQPLMQDNSVNSD